MARLRLLKVIVRPVFVIDDGEHLVEQSADPVTISAAAWPTYATTTFEEGVAQLQARLDAGGADA